MMASSNSIRTSPQLFTFTFSLFARRTVRVGHFLNDPGTNESGLWKQWDVAALSAYVRPSDEGCTEVDSSVDPASSIFDFELDPEDDLTILFFDIASFIFGVRRLSGLSGLKKHCSIECPN